MSDPRSFSPDPPYDPQGPVEPAVGQDAYDALDDPPATPTNNPRVAFDAGRYWSGALATVVVAALIGLVAWFVTERVVDQELQNPPFGPGAAGWAVAGGVFAIVAAALLHLFVVSTPRPATFFGWVVALGTIILAALPFTGSDLSVGSVLTGLAWVVMGAAVWSLLTGVLSRTVVRRTRDR